MRTLLLRLGLALLLAVCAPARGKELPPLEVTAMPGRVRLPAGEQWAKLTYFFRSASAEEWEVVSRSAFFHSLTTGWQSAVIGPFATKLKLPARGQADWQDRAWVNPQIVAAAAEAQALAHGELLLVQSFTLRSASGETAHLSAPIIFRVDAEAPATERIERAHFDATVRSAWRTDPAKNAQLTALLDFADASYEALAAVLGFRPHEGKRVPLRITAYGGSPYYHAAEGGYINIPCEVVESQGKSDWLWVAFPHELAHYFLLEQWPGPPRWFIEGPASFFGNKVSERLGHAKTAAADREKILGWGRRYDAAASRYIFESEWPEKNARSGAAEAGSPGMGKAYALCQQLEAECGAEFFANVFRHMRESGITFAGARDEAARNAILLGAMQTQTDRDLWAWFAQGGLQR